MYLVVKKPGWLVFDSNEYGDEEVHAFQVRHRGARSNTRIVKFEDGSWYLKNGSQLFPLRSIDLKREIGVGVKNGESVCVDDVVNKKWFIKANDVDLNDEAM